MVKIHNTPEERNKEVDKKPKGLEKNIDESLILEMVMPNNKTKTSSLNIRLETSIVNQIETFSKEHNTTKTEVIKDILINHYANKKINKGTFQLKEPVTLIIPKSPELITEYIEHEINIMSTVHFTPDNETTINPLDPQLELYNNKEGYYLEVITEANNLLDSYNDLGGYYNYNVDTEKQYYEMADFQETRLIDKTESNDLPFIYHRGLQYINVKNEDTKTAIFLIDVLCVGNELVRAVIIDEDRALELARITNNHELISFIHQTDNYVNVSELVSYDMTNQELRKENMELKQVIKGIQLDYEDLKLEHDSILESWKHDFNDKVGDNLINYAEILAIENEKLQDRIKEFEERELEYKKTLQDLESVFYKMSNHINK